MTIKEIIKLCGGRKAVARRVDTTTSNVGTWIYNERVPEKHWPVLIEMAGTEGHVISQRDLQEANGRGVA